MPNLDSPFGFEFVDDDHGGTTASVRHYDVGASEVFIGQPVKLAAGLLVPLNGTFANDSGNTNGTMVGICSRNAAANSTNCPVVHASSARFRVQVDDNWAITSYATWLSGIISSGSFWGLTGFASGNTNFAFGKRFSICELAGASTPAVDQYILPVDFEKRPGYVHGPFLKVIVRFHPKLFNAAPAFVQRVTAT